MKKVLCAGHICLDITPVFSGRNVSELSEVLMPGKLIHVGQPDIHLGGSVANTGLAMVFFGADVRLAAKIGRDAFGELVRRELSRHDCELLLTEDERAGTSYTVVLAVPGTDRVFLHDPGANDTFSSDDITDALLDGAGHFHFGYPPLMRGMFARQGAELETIFKRVKARGLTTSLDMAAVDPGAEAGLADWRGILRRVLPYVDYFVPSAEELCFMLDRPRYGEWNARPGGDIAATLDIERDIKPLADELSALCSSVLLIKCGAAGLYYRCESDEGHERCFRPDRVASGTGAGDTCIAAFLTSVLRGDPIQKAISLAAAAGACCVSSYDALSGLYPLDTLSEKIAAGWDRV